MLRNARMRIRNGPWDHAYRQCFDFLIDPRPIPEKLREELKPLLDSHKLALEEALDESWNTP